MPAGWKNTLMRISDRLQTGVPAKRLAALAMVVFTLLAALLPTPAVAGRAGPEAALPASPSRTVPARTLKLQLAGDLPPGVVKLRVTGPGSYNRVVKVSGVGSLTKLRPGRYSVRPTPIVSGGVSYSPSQAVVRVRITKARGARLQVTFQRTARVQPTPSPAPSGPTAETAPASPPPEGVIAEVLDRINSARAAGVRCDGTTGSALPPIGYSTELGALAQWHAEDFAAHRSNDFVADLARSGFRGVFVGESAVVCPKVADPDGVFSSMRDWEFSCNHMFDPRVDRVGIGYSQNSELQNAWVLTFGTSRS